MRSSSDQRLAELYSAHAAGLRRLAYVMTEDVHEAEDLLQEAFVRLGGRLLTLRDPDRAAGYLHRTVVNLARDHGRRLNRESELRRRLEPSSVSSPADPHASDDLWSALMQLPVRHRAVLYLRYFMDMSEEQAAELLGCSASAVKSLTHRASTSLRKSIGGQRS